MEIDIIGLVNDGHLNLDHVFRHADWTTVDDLASYTSCVYGADGCSPGKVEVVLQRAEMYGVEVYRWKAEDDSAEVDSGGVTLSRDEAIEEGEAYAEDSDEELDANDLIEQIVATAFFGDADTDDILEICKEATQHSQGYLLLPAGEFVGHPIGRMWTTNGYLQGDYVQLRANFEEVSYAAYSLLEAITETVKD
jgi:hypothetical protein